MKNTKKEITLEQRVTNLEKLVNSFTIRVNNLGPTAYDPILINPNFPYPYPPLPGFPSKVNPIETLRGEFRIKSLLDNREWKTTADTKVELLFEKEPNIGGVWRDFYRINLYISNLVRVDLPSVRLSNMSIETNGWPLKAIYTGKNSQFMNLAKIADILKQTLFGAYNNIPDALTLIVCFSGPTLANNPVLSLTPFDDKPIIFDGVGGATNVYVV